MRYLTLLVICNSLVFLGGCKDIGFRKLEDAGDKASVQSAEEALRQIELALENYKNKNGTYPRTNETYLFDTLKNYFIVPIDPAHIYRNEKEQTNYIAVGSRRNKIIYHYPPTVGAGPYTLYWVGVNGVDEEGQDDDLFPAKNGTSKQIIRRVTKSFKGKGSNIEFILKVAGLDPDADNAVFILKDGSVLLYKDEWPLKRYVSGRLELTDADKQQIITEEIDRFFRASHFIMVDSLGNHPEIRRMITASEPSLLAELARKDLEVFLYNNGTRTILLVWDAKRKRLTTFAQ